jgi:hypothetical protein
MAKRTIPKSNSEGGSVAEQLEPVAVATADTGAPSGDTKSQGGDTEPQGGAEQIAGFATVSPFDIGAGVGDSGAKRRGRPPGIKNRAETKTSSNLTADIEGLLISLNLGVAALLDCKEFSEIPDEKSKAVADNIKELAAIYNKTMNPKTAAWSKLGVSIASAYGPVLYVLWNRKPQGPPVLVQGPPAGRLVEERAIPKGNGAVRTPETIDQAIKRAKSPSEMWDEKPGLDWAY